MKTAKNKKAHDENKEESLLLSIELMQKMIEILTNSVIESAVAINGYKKIGFPTKDGTLFYPVNEIIFIEAHDSCAKVILTGKREIEISRSLNACEEFFHEFNFCRAHNSYFINVFHVKEYHRGNGGWVLMSDDSTVYVSNGKKDELQGRMRVI